MLIELINKKAFINELIDYSKIVTKGKPTKSVYDLILDTYNIFKNDTVDKIYYVECTQEEIECLLQDFINSFSWDKHLCVCSFLGQKVSVDKIGLLKQSCINSQFHRSFPSYILDDKIKVYISYYKLNKGNIYDIDYAVNTIFH